MLKIQIVTKTSNYKVLRRNIFREALTTAQTTKDIANRTTQTMRNVIRTNKKRKSEEHDDGRHPFGRDNLAKSIRVKTIKRKGQGVAFYVPDMPFLKKNASYWYVINFGGMVPNAYEPVPGVFGKLSHLELPGGIQRDMIRGGGPSKKVGGGSQAFYYEPHAGLPVMFPRRVIKPMNYIGTTRTWLKRVWKQFGGKRVRGWKQAVRAVPKVKRIKK